MAGEPCYRVARGLLLYGKQIQEGQLTRAEFMDAINVKTGQFRAAAEHIGAKVNEPGLRFFDSVREEIAFGPGAGLVLGVSIGSQSLRAAIVDANGKLHCKKEAPRLPNQLEIEPEKLLDRVYETISEVTEAAFATDDLLVDGRLPLLGVSTAWPAPVNRDKKTVGNALKNPGWHLKDVRLDDRVATRLGLSNSQSHAINDAAAAAIGVAYLQTTEQANRAQEIPRLAMVLRLGGGIGGSTIVVEGPDKSEKYGITSGFVKSILTGGVDHLAGEIGHVPIPRELIDRLNKARPPKLGKLEAFTCACVPPSEPVPEHLEAYAGAIALAHRIKPNVAPAEVAAEALADREDERYKRALNDIGTLAASALTGPAAVLNPATIVLTGALAVPEVGDALKEGLAETHVFGRTPVVSTLEGEENDYIRVKGAGLVVLRRQVFRRLPEILGGPKPTLSRRVKNIVEPITNPLGS